MRPVSWRSRRLAWPVAFISTITNFLAPCQGRSHRRGREGPELAQVHQAGRGLGLVQPGHRLLHRPQAGAPAGQGQGGVGGTKGGDAVKLGTSVLQFAQALVVHLHPHLQVLGEVAVGGVLVGVGHHQLRPEARQAPGRDAVSGDGVAFIFAVAGSRFESPVDVYFIRKIRHLLGEIGIGEILVGEQERPATGSGPPD